jgi:peptidoglycan hydrolase CwlO-like protein
MHRLFSYLLVLILLSGCSGKKEVEPLEKNPVKHFNETVETDNLHPGEVIPPQEKEGTEPDADLEELEKEVLESIKEVDDLESNLKELDSLTEELDEIERLEDELEQLEHLIEVP